MTRFKRFLVLAAAVALGLPLASVARGVEYVSFEDCVRGHGYSDEDRQACCEAFGGSWVAIYDHEGELIDEFCDPFEAHDDPYGTLAPPDGLMGKTPVSNQTPPTSGSSTIGTTPTASQQTAMSTDGGTHATLGSPTGIRMG